jgi:polysaccharide export outer membrane protein
MTFMTRDADAGARPLDPHPAAAWAAILVGAFAAVAAVAALALASGCSTTPSHPPAPAVADSPDPHYVIGPLDTLNIVVWRNPELSTTVTVRPDGYISTPLVNDIRAAGQEPAALRKALEQALSTYIRDPSVSVIVSGFQGVYASQIRIVGEASRPQAVPYRKDMTLLDVMIQVGGMTDFADGNGAVLIRGSSGGTQYSLRLKDLLKRGDISANVAVLPGDIIIVPQSWF